MELIILLIQTDALQRKHIIIVSRIASVTSLAFIRYTKNVSRNGTRKDIGDFTVVVMSYEIY